MKIINRETAKENGLKRYFTGEPCKYGHIAERLVSNWGCVECNRIQTLKFCQNNRDWQRDSWQKWYKDNKDYRRTYERKRRKQFPEINAAKCGKRRADRLKATPPWADLDAIKIFYEEAKQKTEETGIPHAVDHIVPLRGKNVCGLHVEYNLQVITAKENSSKRNTFNMETT